MKEQQHGMQNAISMFLKKLVDNNLRNRHVNNDYAIFPKVEFTTDLCYRCNKIVEEGCIKMKRYRWHTDCFSCTRCNENLADTISSAVFDVGSLALFCNICHDDESEKSLFCFENVSLLEQYSFLLWVSLCRLDNLLRNSGKLKFDSLYHRPASMSHLLPETLSKYSDHFLRGYKESPPMQDLNTRSFPTGGRAKTFSEGENGYGSFQASDVKDMPSDRPQYKLFRSSTRSSGRANTLQSGGFEHKPIPEETPEGLEIETAPPRKSGSLVKRLSRRRGRINIFGNPLESRLSKQSLSGAPKQLEERASTARPELQLRTSGLKSNPSIRRAPALSADQCRLQTYLAELSTLQYMVAKHVAVLQLEPLVNDKFTMDELLDLVEQKRVNMWNKLFTSFKANRRGVKPTATFGVPIETLVKRYPANAKLGCGPAALKLPAFLRESILRMKQLGNQIL